MRALDPLLPFLGALTYLIAQHDGMTRRNVEQLETQQKQFGEYVRATAGSGGAAAEIEKGEQLLARGTITQTEFDALKAKAIAGN